LGPSLVLQPYVEAGCLALLQAVTEFLPVSSSGHLVLAQRLLGAGAEPDILFDVLLHIATTVAVLVYLRRDVLALLRGLVHPGRAGDGPFAGFERKAVGLILLANVPTAMIGLGIEKTLLQLVTRPEVVSVMLIVTGLFLWGERVGGAGRSLAEMRPRDAIGIGLFQGIAVLPGISRSGATIIGGIVLGVERDLAARFSLLISIPAIAGAAILELSKATNVGTVRVGPYLLGMVVAGLAGYLAIDVILRLVRQRRFHLFSYYLWPLGLLALLWFSTR